MGGYNIRDRLGRHSRWRKRLLAPCPPDPSLWPSIMVVHRVAIETGNVTIRFNPEPEKEGEDGKLAAHPDQATVV
jgi:hypothetical protein